MKHTKTIQGRGMIEGQCHSKWTSIFCDLYNSEMFWLDWTQPFISLSLCNDALINHISFITIIPLFKTYTSAETLDLWRVGLISFFFKCGYNKSCSLPSNSLHHRKNSDWRFYTHSPVLFIMLHKTSGWLNIWLINNS